MPSLYAHIKNRYESSKKIRKLKKLRTHCTANNYTLQGFDQYQCIFVHIPKCAGVSICRSLFGNMGIGHYSLDTFQQVFGSKIYAKYFKFTFVRNPWDRLLSSYNFLKKGGFNNADRRWSEENLSMYPNFKSFVNNGLTSDNIRSWVHFLPQTDFLETGVTTPKIDFIGRYENLESDFKCVCDHLGVKRKLLKLNISQHEHSDYSSFYDETMRARVAEIYQDDIKALGYLFGE